MAGPDSPDFRVQVSGKNAPARYSLTFGSMLRGGALYESPELESEQTGRVQGGTTTVEPGETHEWAADGPIHLFNNGRGDIELQVNGGMPFVVQAQGSVDAGCPTAKKRTVALAAAGGAAMAGVGGYLSSR